MLQIARHRPRLSAQLGVRRALPGGSDEVQGTPIRAVVASSDRLRRHHLPACRRRARSLPMKATTRHARTVSARRPSWPDHISSSQDTS